MTLEIADTVSRFFAAVDRCDWDAARKLMTNPFHVDYSSCSGEDPSDVSPADLTAAWAKFLPHFDGVHHQTAIRSSIPRGTPSPSMPRHGETIHRR